MLDNTANETRLGTRIFGYDAGFIRNTFADIEYAIKELAKATAHDLNLNADLGHL